MEFVIIRDQAFATGHAASGESERAYRDWEYRTLDSWSRTRRVVAKVEHLPGDVGETAGASQAATAARDAEALERQAAEAEQSARTAAERAALRADAVEPDSSVLQFVRLHVGDPTRLGASMARSPRTNP